jgi:hypothetical protein
MVAAAATLWVLFSFWIIAPLVDMPPRLGTTAMVLLCAELGTLLLWSFGVEGCDDRTCAPVAQAAGIAARTDLPLLAAAFVVFALASLRRTAPVSPGRTDRRRPATTRAGGRRPGAGAASPPSSFPPDGVSGHRP